MDHEPEQQSKRRSPLVLILIIIIVLLGAAAAVLAVGKFGGQELEPAPVSDGEGAPALEYQDGLTVIDEDALRRAVEEMEKEAAKGGIPVTFRNDARSTDGTKFAGYIGNPAQSSFDMFIDIYADLEFTDQLYLSGLIPPGSAIESWELKHPLKKGEHTVYVVLTQVEDDHATLYQQTTITLNFIVE